MPEYSHDVFVSYFSQDRQYISKFVSYLTNCGLDVWWDQKIDGGVRWDNSIEQHLAGSCKVIAFLTKSVFERTNYYVAAEMKRAISQNNLFPIIIGDLSLPLLYEGYILGLQTLKFSNFDHFLSSSNLASIHSMFISNNALAIEDKSITNISLDDIESLLSSVTLRELSLALAIATLEGSTISIINRAAAQLEQKIIKSSDDGNKTSNISQPPSILAPRSSSFNNINAEIFMDKIYRYAAQVECVRFKDPQRGFDLFSYAWDELDQFHNILIEWLDHLGHSLNSDGRLRLGLKIGALASSKFIPIFDAIIKRWILDEHPACREIADISLAIASRDKNTEEIIRNIINDWAHSANRVHLKAAVRLACGYTGMHLGDVPISTLKTVGMSNSADFEVLATMRDSVKFLLESSLESSDNSLLDLEALIESLSSWVNEPEEGTWKRLPVWLFLDLMERLPLKSPEGVAGVLSLESLVVHDKIREATARVFVAALADFGEQEYSPRNTARSVINGWLDNFCKSRQSNVDKSAFDNDVMLSFVRAVYTICPTQRDKDRVVHLIKRFYSKEQLYD